MMAPTIVNGNSIASADSLVMLRTAFCGLPRFGESSGFSSMLFLEEQFAGAAGGFDYGFDQGDAEFTFFEFEDAVKRAARRSRHRILQQRWMISRLQHYARRPFHRLRRQQCRYIARQPDFYARFRQRF